MIIGIDGTSLTVPYPTGTKHYAESLLNAIAKIDKRNTYLIYAPGKVEIPQQGNFIVRSIPHLPILKKQLLLPILVRIDKPDIFHFLDPFGSIFLNHPKIITTVHDLDLSQTYPYKSRHFINRIYCEVTRKFLLNKSRRYITDTKFIKKELMYYLGKKIDTSQVSVIPLSCKDIYKVSKRVKRLRFFLSMGDFSKRKNINSVFKAYSLLPQLVKNKHNIKIVVSTQKESQRFEVLAKSYSLHKYLEIVVSPDNKELKKLYQSAMCFLYPSLYEGFGLPILEAMACGCPVITSSFGAMKEVAGGAALFVNPKSVSDIKNSMLQIAINKKLRTKLFEKGIINVKRFNWIGAAKKTLENYNATQKID